MINTEVLLEELLQRKEEVESKISFLETYRYWYPEGSLRIRKRGQNYLYSSVVEDNKTGQPKDIYIPKSEIKRIRELAQRSYNQKALIRLKQEQIALSHLIRTYQTNNIDTIYSSFCEHRKELVKPVFLPNREYATQWLNQPYTPKPFSPDDKTEHYTAKGERVRSKSEINIANMLGSHEIPYKYECPLYLPNSDLNYPIHPDFTILNVRTGKIYYLEHLGKMDDISYTANVCNRIREYEKNNIFVGDRLLLTMETLERQLDMRTVEKMMEIFFT